MPISPRAGGSGGLHTSRGHDDHLAHLAQPAGLGLLCGRPQRHDRPVDSFRVAGCTDCLDAAVRAGYAYASEGESAFISLIPMQRVMGRAKHGHP